MTKEKSESVDKATGAVPKVKWNDGQMKTSYANVCNVTSTREEMTLFFGTNQTWHAGQDEVTVELSDRVIMNPYAAKRLALLLGKVVGEYERRYGVLDLNLGAVAPAAPATTDKSAN